MEFGLHMQTDNWLVSRELSEMAGPWTHDFGAITTGEYFASSYFWPVMEFGLFPARSLTTGAAGF